MIPSSNIVCIQKKNRPIILATYNQLVRSKFDIRKERSNITDEKPTVNNTARIENHKIAEGLLIIANVRYIHIAEGIIIPAYKIFTSQNPYFPKSLTVSVFI